MACLHPTSKASRQLRFQWSLDNPDIVCYLHALRVELLVHLVMPAIVPTSRVAPFQYWVRFEEGSGGNPHAHGLSYAAGNPSISGLRQSIEKEGSDGDLAEESVQVENEARADLARFFKCLSSEWHPAKDEGGNQLYDFVIENLMDARLGRPQTVNLRVLLDQTLSTETPDLTSLK